MRCHRPALPGGERVVDSLSLSTLRNQPARNDGSLTTTSCAITNSTWTAAVDTEIPKSFRAKNVLWPFISTLPTFFGSHKSNYPREPEPPLPAFPCSSVLGRPRNSATRASQRSVSRVLHARSCKACYTADAVSQCFYGRG